MTDEAFHSFPRRMASRRALWLAASCIAFSAAVTARAADLPGPLPEESVPAVVTLPDKYPDSWVYVHDLHFDSIVDGRAVLVDVASPASSLKGQIPVAQFGNILPSAAGDEIYVGETFYSRLTRGDRTDVITIWDKKTLAPKGEIALPGGKRGLFVTLKNSLQFTNNEKWALVFNFTPGSSVTVVDLAGRVVLGDIELPGCSLAYPAGERGFMSLCADGTMTSVILDDKGGVQSTTTSKPINDIDNDPWFMSPAMVGRTAWFVSFKGGLRGIDLSGSAARDVGGFRIADGKGESWRPGGWQVITADAAGLLYVLMNPKGYDGSHKDGGSEVWIVDPAKKVRVGQIALTTPAISIEVTRSPSPLLVAARPDGSLDVYDAASGKFRHTIAQAAHDPMTMTAVGK